MWQITWPNTPPDTTSIQRCPGGLESIGKNSLSVQSFINNIFLANTIIIIIINNGLLMLCIGLLSKVETFHYFGLLTT